MSDDSACLFHYNRTVRSYVLAFHTNKTVFLIESSLNEHMLYINTNARYNRIG